MIVISISIFNLYFFIQYNVRKKSVKKRDSFRSLVPRQRQSRVILSL